ncbi:Zinc finger, RING/FYVE/PHD-type [Cynara cardunculus var. scolymus]|uniref:Zinc finger, RING/FYVE/PHD-type n=1 Tax=Cynara cardunculus var. scolymus TaxID=59895 RepID=A0A103YGD3_CYNCS|nr:Zinc finger, RING/FYVE/PHD-type [Cynara cardunculus var. scolymus]
MADNVQSGIAIAANRVRKRSERIMIRTSFSKFKNTVANPVVLDEDELDDFEMNQATFQPAEPVLPFLPADDSMNFDDAVQVTGPFHTVEEADDSTHCNVKELTVNSSRTDCIVCLCEFFLGARLAMLERCGHGYHVKCLEAWLKEHPNCPLRRIPVSSSHNQDNTTHNHNLYLKKFYDMVSRYGTSALETMVDWLTSHMRHPLASSALT